MKELFNIEPHQNGPGFLMRLKTGEIDVPDDRGGYIISSGCGSGKTESIKSLIRNKYDDGILYCVDTREELDKMYNWIIDNLVNSGLKREDVMIISSDDEHYISLSEYKDNPEIIMQKKILLITHVRFWTDLINFFLISCWNFADFNFCSSCLIIVSYGFVFIAGIAALKTAFLLSVKNSIPWWLPLIKDALNMSSPVSCLPFMSFW